MTATTSPQAAVGFRSERGPVLAALMLCTGLVALDATIIATAVPSVVKEAVNKADSDAIKKKLEDAGAKVEIK